MTKSEIRINDEARMTKGKRFGLILVISSALSLALCAMASYLWIKSMMRNNYWDTPVILHLGGLPAVYAAFNSALALCALCSLWLYFFVSSRTSW